MDSICSGESTENDRTVESESPGDYTDVAEETFLASVGLQPKDLVGSEPVKSAQPRDASEMPPGWSKILVQRKAGASAGKFDVYIFSPDGRKHRSRTDLARYLDKKGIQIDVNTFDFAVKSNRPTNFEDTKSTPSLKRSRNDTPATAKTSASDTTRSTSLATNKSPTKLSSDIVKRSKINSLTKPKGMAAKLKIRMNFKSKQSKATESDTSMSDSNVVSVKDSKLDDVMVSSDVVKSNGVEEVAGSGRIDKVDSDRGKAVGMKRRADDGDSTKENKRSAKARRATPVEASPDTNKYEGKISAKASKAAGEASLPDTLNGSSGVRRNPKFLKRPSLLPAKRNAAKKKKQQPVEDPQASSQDERGSEMDADWVGDDGMRGSLSLDGLPVSTDVVHSWEALAGRPEDGVRELGAWKPPQSPFYLVEEQFYSDPWRVLVASLFSDKTSDKMPKRALMAFFRLCPTADTVKTKKWRHISEALEPHDILPALARTLAHTLVKFTNEYLTKKWKYPIELHGVDDHGNDAYRIFCINEWKQVAPSNPRLNEYHRWLWANHRVLGIK